MQVLWEAGPCTVAEVQPKLKAELANSEQADKLETKIALLRARCALRVRRRLCAPPPRARPRAPSDGLSATMFASDPTFHGQDTLL